MDNKATSKKGGNEDVKAFSKDMPQTGLDSMKAVPNLPKGEK